MEENKTTNPEEKNKPIRKIYYYLYHNPIMLGEIFEWILLLFISIFISIGINVIPMTKDLTSTFIIGSLILLMSFQIIKWIFAKTNYARISMLFILTGLLINSIYVIGAGIIMFIAGLILSALIKLNPILKKRLK